MTFKQLQYFVSVVQNANFSLAAKQQYMTQPALSRQIQELENEYGVKLLIRNSHNVVLTEAGAEFYQHALDILKQAGKMEARMQNIAQGRTGKLRISMIPIVAPRFIRALSAFAREFPNVHIDLQVSNGAEQISAVRRNDCDLYYSFSTLIQEQENLQWVDVDSDRLVLAVSKSLSFDRENLSSLNKYPLIRESDVDAPFLINRTEEICHSRGLQTENFIVMPDAFSVLLSVTAGIGYAIAVESYAKNFVSDSIELLPFEGDDVLITNSLAWNRQLTNNAVNSFLQILEEQ